MSGYWFHGTMSGVRNYDLVAYTDTYQFEVEIGDNTGQAVLNVDGYLQAKP